MRISLSGRVRHDSIAPLTSLFTLDTSAADIFLPSNCDENMFIFRVDIPPKNIASISPAKALS